MKDLRLKHFAFLFSFLLLACEDTDLATIEEQGDPDMEEAWALVDDYFQSANVSSTDTDVTVLKYNDELQYKTNTIIGTYEPIDEQTITAMSEPGGWVFWYAGGGVKELISIEMNPASQAILGEHYPHSIVWGQQWGLWIPWWIDSNVVNELKYDIVYKTWDDEVVRLDPKIQIKNSFE